MAVSGPWRREAIQITGTVMSDSTPDNARTAVSP